MTDYGTEMSIYIRELANCWKQKKGLKLHRLKPSLSLWTHLGSNQGPPDYESGALTD